MHKIKKILAIISIVMIVVSVSGCIGESNKTIEFGDISFEYPESGEINSQNNNSIQLSSNFGEKNIAIVKEKNTDSDIVTEEFMGKYIKKELVENQNYTFEKEGYKKVNGKNIYYFKLKGEYGMNLYYTIINHKGYTYIITYVDFLGDEGEFDKIISSIKLK